MHLNFDKTKRISKQLAILNNKPLPIYGVGKNSREWIHVNDHCEALIKIFNKGKVGESYNVGSNQNIENLNIAKKLLKISNQKLLKLNKKSKIKFVKDRPGHDFRYSMTSQKISNELDWKVITSFDKGLKKTIQWYLGNPQILNNISQIILNPTPWKDSQ